MTLEPMAPREGVRVLRVSGELDLLSAPPFHDRVLALLTDEPLVLDLTDVTFFDSSGVRAVDGLARAAAGRGPLRVVAPPGGRARRVLDIVGLGGGLVVDDLDQAVAGLRR